MGLLPDFLDPILPYAGAVGGGFATGWNPAGVMAGYGLGKSLGTDPADPYKNVQKSGLAAANAYRDLAGTLGDTPGNKYIEELRGGGPGALGSAYPELAAGYRQPGVTGNEYNRMVAEGSPEYVRQFGGRQAPGLEREGMYEEFVRQSLAGDNPHLARQRAIGQAAINQQMAAKGAGTSGVDAAISNYNAALDAEEYMRRAELAKGAQGMSLERLAQAQGLAGAQTAEDLAGRGQRLSAAEAADRERLARLGGLGETAARSQQLEQQLQLALLQAMQRGDTERVDLLRDAIDAQHGASVSGAQGDIASQERNFRDLSTMLGVYDYGKNQNWWGGAKPSPTPIPDQWITDIENFYK